MCGVWSGKCSHRLVYLNPGLLLMALFGGGLRRRSLVRGSTPLNLGFQNLKIPVISSWFSLLHACGSSCELSAFFPGHHACCLLSHYPTIVDACWQQYIRTKEKNEQHWQREPIADQQGGWHRHSGTEGPAEELQGEAAPDHQPGSHCFLL